MTPSQARNAIKKALKTVIDPKPKASDKDAIWSYFKNHCAYCDQEIERESRIGHIDHLVAEMEGGSNAQSNLVLTCATCNGDEKRELDWMEFIAEKCQGNENELSTRLMRIEKWCELNGSKRRLSEEELRDLDVLFKRINLVFSEAIEELRRN